MLLNSPNQKRDTTKNIVDKESNCRTYSICRIKKFGIMGSKYRNRLKRYDGIFDIVSGLVNYRIIHIVEEDN